MAGATDQVQNPAVVLPCALPRQGQRPRTSHSQARFSMSDERTTQSSSASSDATQCLTPFLDLAGVGGGGVGRYTRRSIVHIDRI
jgi:hypothetical protein